MNAVPLYNLLDNIPWFAWVAIIAMVSGSITSIVTSLIKHQERMAMIHQGMHPDAPAMPDSRKTEVPEL